MNRTVDYLKAEVARLRDELRVRPIITTHGGGTASAPVVPLPWVGITAKGGNTLITTPSNVYGVKRYSGQAMADGWKFCGRQASATCGLSAGAVSSVNILDPGLCYDPTALPTITVTPAPGGGTTAVLTPTVNTYNGLVEGAYLTACGTGYTYANVVFSAPGGGGTTATGTAVLRNGLVVGITITNKGKGYSSPPSVTITGDGASAAATAVLGLGGISLAITTPGSGYSTAPTITIAVPPPQPLPLPPTVAIPGGASWPDGIGWGVIQGGSLTGGLAAGIAALICHDDRGMVPYGLMGDGPVVPYSRSPDSILSWYQTLVRLSIADPNADGVLPAWVPMSGGV